MKVTFLQHESYFRPGRLADYLSRRHGASVTVLRNEEVRDDRPDVAGADLVVSLGSPVSVYRTDVEWVARERRILSKRIEQGAPVLGICFGAQMLASLVGGYVTKIGESHVGWLENDPVVAPFWRGPWFRFHKEHCQLPPSVEVLARSRGTAQAFRAGNAIGLQFHPEIEAAMVQELMSMQSGYGLSEARAQEVLEETRAQEGAIAEARDTLFDEILRGRLNGA